VHSRVAKPSLFLNGCVIGAVNAENKTSYDAARLEFLQIESEGMESRRSENAAELQGLKPLLADEQCLSPVNGRSKKRYYAGSG